MITRVYTRGRNQLLLDKTPFYMVLEEIHGTHNSRQSCTRSTRNWPRSGGEQTDLAAPFEGGDANVP